MKIYSKAAFQFGPGANKSGDIDCFVTVPFTFQTMPDRFANDKTFKLAKVSGMVSVVESTEKKIEIENNEEVTNVDIDPIKQYREKLKTMDRDSVASEAEKLGVKIDINDKLSEIKKVVFEAYKESLNEE